MVGPETGVFENSWAKNRSDLINGQPFENIASVIAQSNDAIPNRWRMQQTLQSKDKTPNGLIQWQTIAIGYEYLIELPASVRVKIKA